MIPNQELRAGFPASGRACKPFTTYPNTFYYPETHETLNLKSKT